MAPLGPQWGRLHKALRDEGGFSVNLSGESPSSGYMVSEPTGEERLPLQDTERHHLLSYSARHRVALSKPGAYHGGWVDDGTVYQDVSRRHANWGRAYATMHANAQAGLYDVGGTGMPDANPLYDRSSSETPVQRQKRAVAAMSGHPLARSAEFSPDEVLRQSRVPTKEEVLSKQFGRAPSPHPGPRTAA